MISELYGEDFRGDTGQREKKGCDGGEGRGFVGRIWTGNPTAKGEKSGRREKKLQNHYCQKRVEGGKRGILCKQGIAAEVTGKRFEFIPNCFLVYT